MKRISNERAAQIINDIAEDMCNATDKELKQTIAWQQDRLIQEFKRAQKAVDLVTNLFVKTQQKLNEI